MFPRYTIYRSFSLRSVAMVTICHVVDGGDFMGYHKTQRAPHGGELNHESLSEVPRNIPIGGKTSTLCKC